MKTRKKSVKEGRTTNFSWFFFYIDWEQRKLGETVQIVMGQSPDGATYSDKPSKYILVQGNADLENGWVKPRVWTTQKTKIGEAGDLIRVDRKKRLTSHESNDKDEN